MSWRDGEVEAAPRSGSKSLAVLLTEQNHQLALETADRGSDLLRNLRRKQVAQPPLRDLAALGVRQFVNKP